VSNTQKTISLNGRTITLLGTAHVSNESIKEVTDATELLELLRKLQVRPWQQKLCLPIFTSILLP